MKTKTPPAAPSIGSNREPAEREIQHAAYLLWIEAGRPEGRDLEFWLEAKEMLAHRHGRDAATRQPAPEIASPHFSLNARS